MTERIDVRTDLVTDADAVTRICSAQDIVKNGDKIIEYDLEKGNLLYDGSAGIYEVTRDSCTCTDYVMCFGRHPCKHIYALRILSGEEYNLPTLIPRAAKAYDFDAEMEHLHDLWVDGIIDFDSFKRCYKAMAKSKATAKKLRKTKK